MVMKELIGSLLGILYHQDFPHITSRTIFQYISSYHKRENGEDTMDLEKRKCRLDTKEKNIFPRISIMMH